MLQKIIDFVIYRYLADDNAEEMSKAIDFKLLVFRDPKVESQFIEAYARLISVTNRRLCVVAFIGGMTLPIWSLISRHSAGMLQIVADIIRIFGVLSIAYVFLSKRLPWYNHMHEFYFVYIGVFVSVMTTTIYNYGLDLFRHQEGVNRAEPMDSVHFLVLIATFSMVNSIFKVELRGAVVFLVINAIVYNSVEYSRLAGIWWVNISFITTVVGAVLTSYRRESYMRRIFWLRRTLEPNSKEFWVNYSHEETDQLIANENSRLKRTMLWFQTYILHRKFDREFEKFLMFQSQGQTRLTLMMAALTILLNLATDASYYSLTPLEYALRSGAFPALYAGFALFRPQFSKFKSGPVLANLYVTILVAVFILGSIVMGINSSYLPVAARPSDTLYISIICQMAVLVAMATGYRFYLYLAVTLLYGLLSLYVQWNYDFTDNGYLVDNNAAFVSCSIFLHHSERMLYSYYTLTNRLKNQRETRLPPDIKAKIEDDIVCN